MESEGRSWQKRWGPEPRRRAGIRCLAFLELFTGVAAVGGGILLAIQPDGSLLMAETSALAGTPFTDWRVPGVLLAGLVGGGGIVAGVSALAHSPYARKLSALFGVCLVGFEAVEACWIGFQPLELVFGAVGVAIVALAAQAPRGTAVGG